MNTFFDQRGQNVQHQVNIAGNVTRVNFGTVTDQASLVASLEQLRADLDAAATAGQVPPEPAAEAGASITRAIEAAGGQEGAQVESHLARAKAILATAASATGLVTALAAAAEAVKNIF